MILIKLGLVLPEKNRTGNKGNGKHLTCLFIHKPLACGLILAQFFISVQFSGFFFSLLSKKRAGVLYPSDGSVRSCLCRGCVK